MKKIIASATLLAFTSMLSACVGDVGDEQETTETPFALGNPNLRIAIVGAGPSGLTAAHELRARGYTHVTVFEKEDHVGGKVNSLNLLGNNVELGAVFASPDYTTTLGLADEYCVNYAEFDTPRFIYDAGVKRDFLSFLLTYTHGDLARIQRGVVAYATVLGRYPEIFQDKISGIHPELRQNFSAFVASTPDLDVVAELARSLVVGFGYGYYDNVPAIYVLKILNMLIKVGPAGLESPPYFSFPDGYQDLWKRVANGVNTTKNGIACNVPALDVQVNSKVSNIVRPGRSGQPIKVTVKKFGLFPWTYDFDAVIVSAPLSAVPSFTTLTTAERNLFNQVESSRYFIDLFGATGVTPGEAVFVQDNAVSSKIDHISVWANPGGSIPLFEAYQITNRNTSVFTLDQNVKDDIHNLTGGNVVALPIVGFPLIYRKEWPDYFPRVNATNMQNGFYEKVEALQGSGGLYYVGGTMSFETVETSARYAKSLVDERFPATF
jgi:oxygen-dependent protoporphyrinogen oxidase